MPALHIRHQPATTPPPPAARPQVQSDLVKDGGHLYFIKHLESRDPGVSPESRAQASFKQFDYS